jgi:hypothetical protein
MTPVDESELNALIKTNADLTAKLYSLNKLFLQRDAVAASVENHRACPAGLLRVLLHIVIESSLASSGAADTLVSDAVLIMLRDILQRIDSKDVPEVRFAVSEIEAMLTGGVIFKVTEATQGDWS